MDRSRLTKDQILKMYLDRSYLGGGAYGVEAAAQYYFGKSIRDVNLSEAAILGGLFKAPSNYAPHVNAEAAKVRANVVLYRMLDVGFISQGELFEAKQHPAEVVNQSAFYSPDWFLDWAYKETLDVINEQNLTSEYVIEVKSTIDLAMQKVAQRIVNEKLEKEAPAYRATQAALVAMTPDGAVRAIVGGKDYEASQFNRATDALRQPGSSFKPFVYLAALKAGFKPTSIVYDSPVSVGSWTPKNYTLKYAGRTTLTNALAHSYNSVPVHLMLQIGRKAIIETAHECGLKSNLLSIASLPLGTNEVTLLDLTTGYATFANGGKLAVPHTVLEIRRPTGELLYSREANAPPPKQVEPEDKIADLNVMMNQVVMGGTGQRALLGFTPQAGKTGTNQSYRDAWFIGYTGQLVTGVWYGNDDFKEMKKATGGTIPALTWHDFMVEALAGRQPVALVGLPVLESHIKLAAANKATVETAMADQPKTDATALAEGALRRRPAVRQMPSRRPMRRSPRAWARTMTSRRRAMRGAFCRTCSPCSGSSRCRRPASRSSAAGCARAPRWCSGNSGAATRSSSSTDLAGPTISRRDSSGTGLANADRLAPAARHKVAWFVEIRSLGARRRHGRAGQRHGRDRRLDRRHLREPRPMEDLAIGRRCRSRSLYASAFHRRGPAAAQFLRGPGI